jgi:hypothetical protein
MKNYLIYTNHFSWNADDGGGSHVEYDMILIPPNNNETFSVPKLVVSQVIATLYYYYPSYFSISNSSDGDLLWKFQNLPVNGNETMPLLYNIDYAEWPIPSNLSEYSDRIATAFTNIMRNYPQSSVPAQGYGGTETSVQIQWGWFSLPMLISFATLVLLIVTIISGPSRGDGGVWKTSELASVLHGLEEQSRSDFGDAWDLSSMIAKADAMEVVFNPEANGFRFHRYHDKEKDIDV